MSRSTATRPARRRLSAALVAGALGIVPVIAAATSASAADPWQLAGEIAGWDSSLVGTEVTVVLDDGGWGVDVVDFTLTGPSFDETVTGDAGAYTLFFDVPDAAEYVDGYLGAKLEDEFDDVTWFPADGLAAIDLGTIDFIPAAYISGTVTDGTDPIEDAVLYADLREIAEGGGWMDDPFTAVTDAAGAYTIKVAAAREYVVSVEADGFSGEYYDDHPACGCAEADFVPEGGPTAFPAIGVDFELDPAPAALGGFVMTGDLDGVSDPVPVEIEVHLYRPVTGGWSPLRTITTDAASWSTEAETGKYRIRFSFDGEWLLIHQVVQGELDGPSPDTEVVDACFVDTAAITEGDTYLVVTSLDEGACGPEPDPSAVPTDPGPATTPPGRGRTATPAAVVATPTPSATATPTATPRPSASPMPAATDPDVPAAASGFDLWWLLWVALVVAVVVLAGRAIYVIRRR